MGFKGYWHHGKAIYVIVLCPKSMVLLNTSAWSSTIMLTIETWIWDVLFPIFCWILSSSNSHRTTPLTTMLCSLLLGVLYKKNCCLATVWAPLWSFTNVFRRMAKSHEMPHKNYSIIKQHKTCLTASGFIILYTKTIKKPCYLR